MISNGLHKELSVICFHLPKCKNIFISLKLIVIYFHTKFPLLLSWFLPPFCIYTPIEEEVITTVFHARKSLLFDKTSVWVKKDNSDFDVTMGSYDGAELCELVGRYLLNLLTNEFGKNNIGLYRDDGLSCFQNISGPGSEKIKKKMCKIFKENGLKITVECNLAITDFLDATSDLKSGTYYPYRKQNNEILYIRKQSNHPPSIIKQINDK